MPSVKLFASRVASGTMAYVGGGMCYSVMQSDGNSLKTDTFREDISSKLKINLDYENLSEFVSTKRYYSFRTYLT